MFLDKFCKVISTTMSCQSDCNFPRTSFPWPLLMLCQLHASEYPGVLLVLVMSLYSHACWSTNMLDGNFWETPQTLMQKQSRSFIIYLRCYSALRPGTSWMQFRKDDIDSSRVSNTIRTAIEKVVAIVDRQECLGMKLTKVNCPTHINYNLPYYVGVKPEHQFGTLWIWA